MNVLAKIRSFQRSAPVNIEALIESFGIKLDREADLHPEIAGQIACLDNRQFKISVNASDNYYRRRFTMAHELGHFLMHRDLIGEGTDDNRAYRSVDSGKFFNTRITPAHETEANRFAANLLMPAPLVADYSRRFRGDIKQLSTAFKVSSGAISYRLSGLQDAKRKALA